MGESSAATGGIGQTRMQRVCSRAFIVTVRFDVLRAKHAGDKLAK